MKAAGMKVAGLAGEDARWRLLKGWGWLNERIWSIEHAYERSRTSGRVVDDTRLRIFFILALFALTFLALGFEASRVALFGPTSSGAGVAGPALARADLVDRQGRLLAADLVHYGLYVDAREVWGRAETRSKLLALLPRLTPERLNKTLRSKRREFVIGGLTPQEKDKLHDLGLPGVEFEEEPKRVYPLRKSAAHLIGFADAGGKGLSGVERAMDPQLRAAAAKGEPIALAMDLRVQGALEDELRRGIAAYSPQGGALGVVTDIQTGEILALSSMPDFDANSPGGENPDHLVNRVAGSVYEMGSTFKILTFAMGLDSGAATIHSTFDANAPLRIGNRLIHDYHAENRVLSMEDIFIHSSNIGTARLALSAGRKTLTKYFESFGLFEPVKVELTEATRPILPREWNETTVASASFGHAISVTPLHIAAAVGGIMNGGVYTPLTVMKRPAGAKIPGQRRIVSEETSRAMLDLMRMNVLRGSGGKAEAEAKGLRVGGKTGSADKAIGGKYDRTKQVSSFAAVFPTDGPMTTKRYLVLILYDQPQATAETAGFRTAGWNAAPTAGRVIDRIAPFLGVARAPTTPLGGTAKAPAAPVNDESTGAPL